MNERYYEAITLESGLLNKLISRDDIQNFLLYGISYTKKIDTSSDYEYYSIELPSDYITSNKHKDKTSLVLNKILDELCKSNGYKTDKLLVVGLGNSDIEADSLGHMAIKNITPTKSISLLEPSIEAKVGYSSYDCITALTEVIKPSLIIVIDTLSASKLDRLGSVLQVTNKGIQAGSGVGNTQPILDKNSLGCPIIAIGVPLVIYVSSILKDIFDKNLPPKAKKYASLIVTPSNISKIVQSLGSIIATSVNNI